MMKTPNFLKRPFIVILLVVSIGIIIFSASHSFANGIILEGACTGSDANAQFRDANCDNVILAPVTADSVFNNDLSLNKSPLFNADANNSCGIHPQSINKNTGTIMVGCKKPDDPTSKAVGVSTFVTKFPLRNCQLINEKRDVYNNNGEFSCRSTNPPSTKMPMTRPPTKMPTTIPPTKTPTTRPPTKMPTTRPPAKN